MIERLNLDSFPIAMSCRSKGMFVEAGQACHPAARSGCRQHASLLNIPVRSFSTGGYRQMAISQ